MRAGTPARGREEMPVNEAWLGTFHHVGVAVDDVAAAAAEYETRLGAVADAETFHDEAQGVRVRFLSLGGLRMELLEPAASPSPLDAVIRRGIALYHTCYEVDDLDPALQRLRDSGVKVISEPKPAVAFQGRRVAFVICRGLMIELLEKRPGGAAGD